ncbi:hypothetical protein BPAE_0138g00170 [Botrytis paeoniae]|uniref:Uncharacterized protein n=1 Tax=Botrytis paeoniae TaxID=278948 RepID=A0A4Z1FEG1_9HELO|nr:hypothetical protein BPAE_0138g00170 [Botrytis paeoniae]
MMGPPNLTQKKWRAYCAFRKLDTSGKLAEMQERLRDYIKTKEVRMYSESSSSSNGFVLHLVMPPQAGSGFENGIIFGRTRASVKQIVEEMCDQIKCDITKGYVEKTRNSETEGSDILSQRHSPALSDDATCSSQSGKDWTEEEERISQAVWNYDESKKRRLNFETYTYRLEELCSFTLKDPFVDDGRYIYDSDEGWVDHAPYA